MTTSRTTKRPLLSFLGFDCKDGSRDEETHTTTKRRAYGGDDRVIHGTAAVHVNRSSSCQTPDLVVAVGDTKEEFECFKLLLCLASDYFDAMLSNENGFRESQSSRIEFPHVSPQEWKLVYSFVNPQTMRHPQTKITNDNVWTLIKLFHEFQMISLLKECDEFVSSSMTTASIATMVSSLPKFNSHGTQSQQSQSQHHQTQSKKLDDLFMVLQMSDMYGLTLTQTQVISELILMLQKSCHVFQRDHVEQLSMFLRQQYIENQKQQQNTTIINTMPTRAPTIPSSPPTTNKGKDGSTTRANISPKMEELWNTMKLYLPKNLSAHPKIVTRMEHKSFVKLLYLGIQVKSAENERSIMRQNWLESFSKDL